jgi:hypothetical protein
LAPYKYCTHTIYSSRWQLINLKGCNATSFDLNMHEWWRKK